MTWNTLSSPWLQKSPAVGISRPAPRLSARFAAEACEPTTNRQLFYFHHQLHTSPSPPSPSPCHPPASCTHPPSARSSTSLSPPARPARPRTIFKTASTALLSIAVYPHSHLAPALALGSLGDLFLSYAGETPFLYGLLSFLTAHLFYVHHFYSLGNGSISGVRLYLAAGMLLLAPVMSFLLLPNIGTRLRVPVVVYSTVILTMVLAVLTVDNDQVVTGAVMFALSDTLLSTDEFLMPKDSGFRNVLQYSVWILYYSGQFLIATGVTD